MSKAKVVKEPEEDIFRWEPDDVPTKQLIEISHDSGFEVGMVAGGCEAIADLMTKNDAESRKVFSFLLGAASVLRKASYNIAVVTSEFEERCATSKEG